QIVVGAALRGAALLEHDDPLAERRGFERRVRHVDRDAGQSREEPAQLGAQHAPGLQIQSRERLREGEEARLGPRARPHPPATAPRCLWPPEGSPGARRSSSEIWSRASVSTTRECTALLGSPCACRPKPTLSWTDRCGNSA